MAKWKTTLQMLAICLLLLRGAVSPGAEATPVNPIFASLLSYVAIGASAIGLLLLWVAMWLTVVTGWAYFRKGLPYIREKEVAAAKPAAQHPED
jgi:CDP-diacylglycerol--glycerol-3-phosphate 3-phosphatidyltransferase